jgi:hypothetical protein
VLKWRDELKRRIGGATASARRLVFARDGACSWLPTMSRRTVRVRDNGFWRSRLAAAWIGTERIGLDSESCASPAWYHRVQLPGGRDVLAADRFGPTSQ